MYLNLNVFKIGFTSRTLSGFIKHRRGLFAAAGLVLITWFTVCVICKSDFEELPKLHESKTEEIYILKISIST